MTTTQTVSILGASLFVVTMVLFVCLFQLRNHLSTTPSPTPTSTPSTPSDPLLELTRMMMTTMQKESTENRRLVEVMMLGREIQPGPLALPSSTNSIEVPSLYDPDSTALAPGIEAILAREVEEDEQLRLMKERAALQERLKELTLIQERQTNRDESEDSSPGPWSAQTTESDLLM